MARGAFFYKKNPGLVDLMGLLLTATLVLLLSGCNGGSSSYDSETATTTPTQVMINTTTLNSWVTNGYGTDAYGYNKMVILDVDTAAGYAAGHIPGAYHLDTNSDLHAERSNGVSYTASQVPNAVTMDALIRRTGINERTVVVLVGNSNLMNVGRAYFNFRYWGFPKERLRVLNGTKNASYRDGAGFALSNTPPTLPTPSTYSVADLSANISLRASLEEMISVAEDNDPLTVVIDARTAGEYNGSDIRSGVAFGGHIRGAVLQDWSTLVDPANPTALRSNAALRAMMEAVEAGPGTTVYTYCQTSWRAAATFLTLDAVLGWPVKIYDGAWLQWGMMARNDLNYGGALEPDSPWRTDRADRSGVIKYNNRIVSPESVADSFAPAANLVNEEDKAACASNPAVVEDLSGLLPEPASIMISPADLAGWLNNPATFTAQTGYGNLVVLHVDSAAGYAVGHIPGAFLLNTAVDQMATRSDGIAPTINQVPTRAQMDALIQRTGINADTVVVFTTSSVASNMMQLGRSYFNFRYWGFPKERLRVLDGNANQYTAATGVALVTAAPAQAVSTYTVCALPQNVSVDRFRASFEEMFDVAQGGTPLGAVPPTVVIADARSAEEYAGDAGKTTTAISGTYVAFEGHVKGAEHQEWTKLIADGKLLTEANLVTAMNEIGASIGTTVYTYCRTSWRAAVNFLALDGALGWPVKIYDGAWIQWGQMASNELQYAGSLNPASPWRTDRPSVSEAITYNKTDNVVYLGANSYAPHANLINQEDAAIGGGTTGGGTTGSSSPPPATPGY